MATKNFYWLFVWLAMLPATSLRAQGSLQYYAARQQMVDQFVHTGELNHPRVIEALRNTPRHEFIPPEHRRRAYVDMGLPIGEQQTISSPFIVGFMTEALDPQPTDRVLEIGTGSGYQAAILSPLVDQVWTIEIIESLGQRAQATLKRLGYRNVHVKIGDGFAGWPEHAPFDKIIVTCSPEKVPQPLVEQLREGGRMVIPVGERYQQSLYLYQKVDGKLRGEVLQPTLFVPMLGQAEQQRSGESVDDTLQVVNGDFEQPVGRHGFIPGWYYQRQAVLEEDSQAPAGSKIITFRNETPGRDSHLLQGIPMDGSKFSEVRLSAWIRSGPILAGPYPDMQPNVLMRFYDAQRREVAVRGLAPWREVRRWRHVSQVVRVPPQAREAILHIGLFGAVGELSVDGIELQVVR